MRLNPRFAPVLHHVKLTGDGPYGWRICLISANGMSFVLRDSNRGYADPELAIFAGIDWAEREGVKVEIF